MSFYGELYRRSEAVGFTSDATALEVEYLAKAFSQLNVAGPVADLGCGTGRHAGLLSARDDFQRPLLGVDFDADSLRARPGQFLAVGADFRRLPFRDQSLAGAYSWLVTLFGFSPRERQKIFREIRRCLKPGGLVVIHAVTFEFAAQNFQGTQQETLPNGTLVQDEMVFDGREAKCLTRRTVTSSDGKVLCAEMTVYHPRLGDLSNELKKAGLSLTWAEGDSSGSPFSPTNRDLIVGAHRR
jgi:ubiquinone/menaquinone biosynthesis C-methylase UbiE